MEAESDELINVEWTKPKKQSTGQTLWDKHKKPELWSKTFSFGIKSQVCASNTVKLHHQINIINNVTPRIAGYI